MTDHNDPRIVFEHQLRAFASNARKEVEAQTGASYMTVTFERRGEDDARWIVNSWGNGTQDITTRGAVLHVVVEEHIRRVNREKGLTTLPALIVYDTNNVDSNEG